MELFSSIAPFLLIIPLFYFLLIRPQQQQQRRTREMQDGIQARDYVLVNGGFKGQVRHVEEGSNVVTLELGKDGNKVELEVMRYAITENISATERAAAEAEKNKKK